MKDVAFEPLDALPKLRVIQFNGRRYAIRLETVFWDILRHAVAAGEARLNEIVAGIAASHAGNLTSALRAFAARWVVEQLQRERLKAGGTDIATLADACPTPCFVVEDGRRIVLVNPALARVLTPSGMAAPPVPLEQVFRLAFGRPAKEAWMELAQPDCPVMTGRLACMLPSTRLSRPFRACRVGDTPFLVAFFLPDGAG